MRILSPLLAALLFSCIIVGTVRASEIAAPSSSSGGCSAPFDFTVKHPDTGPVIVPLFVNVHFANATFFVPFHYAPPAGRAWAQVVLRARFTCSAGRQYDRTCTIFVGDTNVYFGTTEEPTAETAPSWSVERDISDYASLLMSPQEGAVDLQNLVNSKYTGVITGSAEMLFYPEEDKKQPVATDEVIPMNENNVGTTLKPSCEDLTKIVTFPRNVTSVVLDVIAQSQADDEFWYTNVPNDDAEVLQSFGGTAFREVEVLIDNRPAGVAPIFPWIYTGGIIPQLWRPIPGIGTLNLKPYRVDLTPFAGLLDNGQPHKITIRVLNALDHFQVAAALLIHIDRRYSTLSGALTKDTLWVDPHPGLAGMLSAQDQEHVHGLILTTSDRTFTISGFVESGKLRVATSICEQASFDNSQTFFVSPTLVDERLWQNALTAVTTTTRICLDQTAVRQVDIYRLMLHTTVHSFTGKTPTLTTDAMQSASRSEASVGQRAKSNITIYSETVCPSATVEIDTNGIPVKLDTSSSSQTMTFRGQNGQTFRSQFSSLNGRFLNRKPRRHEPATDSPRTAF